MRSLCRAACCPLGRRPVVGGVLRLETSADVTLTLASTSPGAEQYVLRVLEPVLGATRVAATLPWRSAPTQINVWRGAHVWHVANTTKGAGTRMQQAGAATAPGPEAVVEFEALPGLDYLIERQCVRSMDAGYNDGRGGWLCKLDQPYDHHDDRVDEL
eukprot:g7253.t1